MSWTQFWDMHSGGRQKEKWARIYIEAPEAEAKIIFYNRFGHNPERVTCTCCGEDYSTNEYPTLEEASAYHRGCAFKGAPGGGHYVELPDPRGYHKYQTVEEYAKNDEVLIIRAADIKPGERLGEIPRQGYVWVD